MPPQRLMQRGVERRTRAARLAVAACLLLSIGAACSYLWRGTGRAAASVAAQEVDVLGASERGGPRLQSAAAAPPEDTQPQLYTYRVVHAYPHDRGSFTQGLVVCSRRVRNTAPQPISPPATQYAGADRFYESSGQYGESSVRLVELATGAVVKRTNVDASLFAEGLVLSYDNATLLQLTWRSGKGISYDAQSLRRLSDFNTGLQDGWGITNGALPSEYLATDGTHRLYTLDAQSLQSTVRGYSVTLTRGSSPFIQLAHFLSARWRFATAHTPCVCSTSWSSFAEKCGPTFGRRTASRVSTLQAAE